MDATLARLVDYSAGFRFSDLAPSDVHEAKRRLIDTLACAVGGFDEPLSRVARGVAARQSGFPSATVWGCKWTTTPEAAAFANGVMLRCLDLSDMYRVRSGGHPSDVIAAVWATADAVRASGADMLEAMTLAYEVYCTFCEAIDINSAGWDQPVYGVIASTVGSAKLLGLSRDQTGHAVSLALAPNMALMQTRKGDISAWKGAAAANAARNAVFAAFLAQAGVTGPGEVFEGESGLWRAVGRFDWHLGNGRLRLPQTNLKRYPVCYHGQGAIAAALALRGQVAPDLIEAIAIETYAEAVTYMGSEPSRWAPKNRETADHSLPYVVAAALVEGDVTAGSFDQDRLSDPAIGRLMRSTTVVTDPELASRYPGSAPCRITARLFDGRSVTSDIASPEGHSDNPLGDAGLKAKFMAAFTAKSNEQRGGEALEALWRFDGLADVTAIAAVLAVDDDTPASRMAMRETA